MDNDKYKSKNQVVYEMIRDAIISGEFEPGSRIVIDDLAIQYGVSHSPIRECIRQLEADGFVTIRPYAGVTVTDLKPDVIMEVFALLESLEIISTCRVCNHATDLQIQDLAQLINDMETLATSPEKWSAKNIELHMLICDMAEMTMTKNMMYRALHHWDRLRRYYLEGVSARRVLQAHQEHCDILKAIQQRDEKRVEAVIRHHNKAALEDYLRYIKQEHQVDLSYPYG